MNKINYQKELDKVIEVLQRQGRVPRLLLHSCCAPCSSYVLEYLSRYFEITVFYYNPNIYPPEEFGKRVEEQKRLIAQLPAEHPISFLDGPYEPERFYEMAKGLEQVPEGGARCFKCYRLRLTETAEMARAGKYDYFTTTLSISPLKNAEKLNEIGGQLAKDYGVDYLYSDFKNGTVTSAPQSCPGNTASTGRITVAVCSPCGSARAQQEAAARQEPAEPKLFL